MKSIMMFLAIVFAITVIFAEEEIFFNITDSTLAFEECVAKCMISKQVCQVITATKEAVKEKKAAGKPVAAGNSAHLGAKSIKKQLEVKTVLNPKEKELLDNAEKVLAAPAKEKSGEYEKLFEQVFKLEKRVAIVENEVKSLKTETKTIKTDFESLKKDLKDLEDGQAVQSDQFADQAVATEKIGKETIINLFVEGVFKNSSFRDAQGGAGLGLSLKVGPLTNKNLVKLNGRLRLMGSNEFKNRMDLEGGGNISYTSKKYSFFSFALGGKGGTVLITNEPGKFSYNYGGAEAEIEFRFRHLGFFLSFMAGGINEYQKSTKFCYDLIIGTRLWAF